MGGAVCYSDRMVSVTISIPDGLYLWIAEKAETEHLSIEKLIEGQVTRLKQGDPDDPEFLAAVRESIDANRHLLMRLAE